MNNLKAASPNLDEAIQNVGDIFAMLTKFLDQMSRTGVFHFLSHKELIFADTCLHNYNDLKKTEVNSPLSGYRIFGSEFERKLNEKRIKRQTDVRFVARSKF